QPDAAAGTGAVAAALRQSVQRCAVRRHDVTALGLAGRTAQPELLAFGFRGPLTEAQRADVEAIHRNERHLLSLIEEVLTFAKLDAGRLRLEPEDVRVSAALASITDLIAPQMEQKDLEYVLEPCDPSLAVFADVEK